MYTYTCKPNLFTAFIYTDNYSIFTNQFILLCDLAGKNFEITISG